MAPTSKLPAPVAFIGEYKSSNTIAVLSDLLDRARAGECIGLAFVAHYHQRCFEIGITGEAERSPIFTLGTLQMLERSILDRVAASPL